MDASRSADGASDAAASDEARHGNATTLLVEDGEQVRPVTAGFLRDMGYMVIKAGNAEAATILVHTLEQPDLVVTDVSIPRIDGPTLAARLRAD